MSREPEAAIDDPEDDKLERMEKEKFPGEAPWGKIHRNINLARV